MIRQIEYIVMMTKEGSTRIVNFMTPETGVLVQGCGHISPVKDETSEMMTKEGSTTIGNCMTLRGRGCCARA